MAVSRKLKKIISQIQNQLVEVSDPQQQKILYSYFKEQVGIRGMKTQQMENVSKQSWQENKSNLSFKEAFQIGVELFKDPHQEDKCVGINYFKAIHKEIQNQHIDQVQNLIKQGYVKDWGTIDALCSRLLAPWALLSKENTFYIANWRFEKENLWIRRASCVTFVHRVKKGDSAPNFKGFSDLMFEICKETVQYDERFNQLGSGWLMRGLTIHHKERAIKFIEDNYNQYSREGLRYAIEKLDNKERKRLLNYDKSQKLSEQQLLGSQEIEEEESEEELQIKPKKINRKKQKIQ